MTDNKRTASAYLDGWRKKDIAAIAATLHPEVTFTGPMTRFAGRDAVLASFEPLLPALLDMKTRHLLADGDRVAAVYDFVCAEPIGSVRMAELLGFDDGSVRSIEMFFDPRPFLAAMQAQS